MNRLTSNLLPRLNVTEEPTFNQSISFADLTERPTESFQLSEDRATTEAYALYHDFLNIFQTSLDAESSLPSLEAYADTTSENGRMLKELSRQLAMSGRNVDELKTLSENLIAESSTWRLLRYVIAVKEEVSESFMDEDNSATIFSEKLARDEIRKQSGEIRHLEAVLEWLQSNANDQCSVNYYSSNVTHENTLHSIKVGKMELDLNPDCPVKDLHVRDRQEIQKFSSETYKLIRAGRIHDAITRCIESGQCWKAAMMKGHVLYHNPDLLDMDGDQEGTEERDLWKLAALGYSGSQNQSLFDRAAIGALCGNTEPLLQIAQSWEDRAWALLIGHLDVTMEEMIRSGTIGDNLDLPATYWKQKQPIENLLQKASATTDQQDSIYRKIQEFLIEDDFGNLAEYINQLECTNKHESRFIAHMAITLQQLTVTNTSNNPIRVYSTAIAQLANPDFNPRGDAILVATYAQQLDQENATQVFSMLLTQLSSMNEENRNYFIQLAEKNGLDVFGITHQTVSQLQLAEQNEENAFDILLSNKKLEESIDLACKMIRNMIVLSRDEDARVAVEKLVEAGAMDLKNNEKFILFKSHLEALELFSEWSQLSMQSPRLGELSKPQITSTSSFIQRIQLEKQWESKIGDELKWKKQLKEKALSLKQRIMIILKAKCDWMDDESKSVCIPRLVVSSLKALIGSDEHEECLEIVNLLFSESNQLYKCLNTQTAPDILTLVTQATSKLLENGKTL